MLEKVKQYALEKYAGDEALAAEFVEGFVKQASQKDMFGFNVGEAIKGAIPSQDVGSGFAGAIGKGLGGLAIGLGIHGLNQAFAGATHGALHNKFLEALARAISSNRILREADKAKVEQYGETIFKFAPHVAGDSNLLSSILANAIHGEGIDPMTIKTLGDLEARFIENRGAGGFSPKQYV